MSSISMAIFEDSEDYLVQYYNQQSTKLVVCIRHTFEEGIRHTFNNNKKDFYSRLLLNLGYDVIYIRNKWAYNLYDADLTARFDQIAAISKNYSQVDGFFMCGGNVPGLYFSKQINYQTIYCAAPRFLDGMTFGETADRKFINHRVTADKLNTSADYIVINNDDEDWDFEAKFWLDRNIDRSRFVHVQYYAPEINPRPHLLTEMFELKELRDLLTCLFNKKRYNHRHLNYYVSVDSILCG